MKRLIIIFLIFIPTLIVSEVTVKIKDITFFDGLKGNQVYGYGLVVGLQGTGDTRRSMLTKSSLRNLLLNLGMESDDIVSKNTAAVMITAQLPPFVRVGDRVDITVSSIGDAKSLEGGILIQSPLKGADNQVYVVAQGGLAVPKASRGGRGGKVVKTVATITNGGIIEKDIEPNIINKNAVSLVLKNFDYTIANNILEAVKKKYPGAKPTLLKNGKIQIQRITTVPFIKFISTIENLEVKTSSKARVVVSERDGTIVTGGFVKISEAMVSKEGILVEIRGSTKKGSVSHLKNTTSVKDLVDALNATGASTKDIIAILKALKAAGSLHADLIVR